MKYEWTPQHFSFSIDYARFVRNLDDVLESDSIKAAMIGVSREKSRGLRDWKRSFVYSKVIDSPPGWPYVSATGFLFANDPFWKNHLPYVDCPLLTFVGFGREQQSGTAIRRIDWLESFFNQILTKMPSDQWQKLHIENNFYLISYQCCDLWLTHANPLESCQEFFLTKLTQLQIGLKQLK